MEKHGAGISAHRLDQQRIDALLNGTTWVQMESSNHRRRRSDMGFVEYFDETTGEWTNIEDVPLYDTINCQLCNEPTEAHDIVAEIKFKDDQPIVGAWQCRKCKAVNG